MVLYIMSDVYEYSTVVLGVLLVLSEVLPFIKKHNGNGITESLVCLLRGSSCMTERLADVIEKCDESDNKV